MCVMAQLRYLSKTKLVSTVKYSHVWIFMAKYSNYKTRQGLLCMMEVDLHLLPIDTLLLMQ